MTSPAHSPAVILFHMPYLPKLALNLQAYGDPESLRLAIRRACSRRRSIVTLRPTTFFCNLVHALVCYGLDITSLSDYREVHAELPVKFLYEIKFLQGYPFIVLGEDGNWKGAPIPLFEFLGYERRAEARTPNISKSGKKLGRPTNLSKRLAKLKAEGKLPEDFDKSPVAARDTSESKIPGEINECVYRLGPRRFGIYFPDDAESEREDDGPNR